MKGNYKRRGDSHQKSPRVLKSEETDIKKHPELREVRNSHHKGPRFLRGKGTHVYQQTIRLRDP